MNEETEAILNFINEKGKVRINDLAIEMNMSYSAAQNLVRHLKQFGYVIECNHFTLLEAIEYTLTTRGHEHLACLAV